MPVPTKLSEKSVVSLLARRPMASVTALADELSIPSSTAVGVLARLLDKGVVFRREVATGSRGRPSYLYGLRVPGRVAAFQLDGTQLAGALFAPDLTVLAAETAHVPPLSKPDEAAALVRDMLYALAGRASLRVPGDVPGVAISVNAVRARGTTLTSTVLPWVDRSVERVFSTRVGVPVRLAATPQVVAEYQLLDDFPAPRSMAYLNVGDGVSGHFSLLGRQHRGATGRGGELGHVTFDPAGPPCGCGRRGCLEALCSGPAVAGQLRDAARRPKAPAWLKRAAAELSGPRAVVEELWQHWQRGDAAAVALVDPLLDRLAWGLGLLVNYLDPAVIVAGGYVLQNKKPWLDELSRRATPWVLYGDRRDLSIRPARTTDQDQLRVIAMQYHQPTRPTTTTTTTTEIE